MIIESLLAVVALIAAGVVWTKVGDTANGALYSLQAPPTIFAGGIATMFAEPGTSGYNLVYTLLTLAVSVFALTSLDSGTRLARYMFSELFTPEGQTYDDLKGARKFFATPIVGTLIMVIVGCTFGLLKLSQIWGVFGAANQLLAGIAMLAVAAWLGQVGKSNGMFFIPMIFMLCATLTSLVMTVIKKISAIAGGTGSGWGDWFQMIWSIILIVLAIILVIEGISTLSKQKKEKKAAAA